MAEAAKFVVATAGDVDEMKSGNLIDRSAGQSK